MVLESFTATLFFYLVGAVIANNVAVLFARHYGEYEEEEAFLNGQDNQITR